jgi:hypothetical protein
LGLVGRHGGAYVAEEVCSHPAAEKQKRGEKKSLGFQYPLQGHVLNDITSFY